jgi:hypothetical protein
VRSESKTSSRSRENVTKAATHRTLARSASCYGNQLATEVQIKADIADAICQALQAQTND